jgi:transposase
MGLNMIRRGFPLQTDKNRAKYSRDHLRYPSDLTDDEGDACRAVDPSRETRRRTDMRAVMNGVIYILSTGCQWRSIPKDFPPRSTLHDYFTWNLATARRIGAIAHCTSNAATRWSDG